MNDTTTSQKTCAACFQSIDPRASRCPHCTERQGEAAEFTRGVEGRMVAGVCAALAKRVGWDAVFVRLAFVVSLAVTGGMALWVYFALWALTPWEAGGRSPALKALDSVGNLFNSHKPGADTAAG